MYLLHVNILAVIVSAVACMLIGTAWYSNMLFAKQWMASLDKKMDEFKSNSMVYAIVFGCFLLMSFVFGKILYYTRVTDVMGSVELAFMIWVGIVLTTIGVNYLFEGKNQKLYLINIFYHLANLLAISVIMGLWK